MPPRVQNTPLHRQVTDLLRQDVLAMPGGTRLASEPTLAKEFGVGLATVREALRVLASEGLVNRQQGRGTFTVGQDKMPGRHVALLIDQDARDSRTSGVYLSIAQNLRRLLRKASINSRIYIGNGKLNEEKQALDCEEFFVELEKGTISAVGAVLATPHPSWTRRLEERSVPMIGFGRDKTPGVFTDTDQMVHDAIDLLYSRGRRRIAMMCWGGYTNSRSRIPAAYREALERHGLRGPSEHWIHLDRHPSFSGVGYENFRRIWSIPEDRPDALLVTDDMFGPGVVMAMMELGVTPSREFDLVIASNKGVNQFFCPFPLIRLEIAPEQFAEVMAHQLETVLRGETPEPPLVRLVPEIRIENEPQAVIATPAFA